MLESLKEIVLKANLELPQKGLVLYTWGNVSGIDRETGLVVIKGSGVSYEQLSLEHMVVVDLDGNRVEGEFNPSTDTMTHLELYKAFPEIGGVVHTHSHWATIYAQAGCDIVPYGTTHADYFYGPVYCTRPLSENEIAFDYEKNTGLVIIETFKGKNVDPMATPAVIVCEHGPFTWGKTPEEAVYHSVVLEEVTNMAFATRQLKANGTLPISQSLLDKHYLRKHGKNAYYGQGSH